METRLARRSLFQSIGAALLVKALERVVPERLMQVRVNGHPIFIGEGTTGGKPIRFPGMSPWVAMLEAGDTLLWAGAAIGYALVVPAKQPSVPVEFQIARDVSDSSELR